MMRLDHLPNQRPGEKTQLILRRHWIIPFHLLLVLALLYAIPAVGAWYFWDELLRLLERPVVGTLILLVVSTYALGAWLFSFMEFTDYYLDVWVVTNERVLSIEQKGLFTRVASELHLAAVQDVTSEVSGMAQTLMGFGTIQVQTAGENTRFTFKDIPHPEEVREQIVRLVQENKLKHQSELAVAAAEAARK